MTSDNSKITVEDIYMLIKEVNSNLSQKIENIEAELKSISTTLIDEVNNVNNRVQILEKENSQLKDRLDTIERKQKINNLIIYGLKEEQADTDLQQIEEIVKNKLQVNLNSHEITNIHRIGKKGQNKRPLLITLLSQMKRKEILQKRKNLKGTNVFITEDLIDKDLRERKILVQHLKQAKKDKKEAYINKEKLIIDGQTFTIKDLERDIHQNSLSKQQKNDLSTTIYPQTEVQTTAVTRQLTTTEANKDRERKQKETNSEEGINTTGALPKTGPFTRSTHTKRNKDK